MHVIFSIEGHVKIEHSRHIFDVKTAGCHIGTNQQIDFTFFEGLKGFEPFVLRLVAMQCSGNQTLALKRARQTGTTEFAVDKNEGLFDAALFQHGFHDPALVVILRTVKTLLHGGSCFVGARHFNGDGVL